MKIGLRLLLGYFLIVAVAGYFVLSIFVQEVKPGVRRATEGTLVDTANLLAQIARQDMQRGDAAHGQLAQAFTQLNQRPIGANISGIRKDRSEYHVYLTDAQGRVIFDSAGRAQGQDYSRWNDVYRTLRGQYGARSTRSDPQDENSSVMYVAAPVIEQGRIIGVLTVGKPNSTMAPVIKRSERRILWAGALLLGIALLIGAVFVWWITRSIGRLVRYADGVAQGENAPLPKVGGRELTQLAQALESMRLKLEGKAYIEQYAHTLTHELKSPLAAIRGAAELLQELPPPETARRFHQYRAAKRTHPATGGQTAGAGAAGESARYGDRAHRDRGADQPDDGGQRGAGDAARRQVTIGDAGRGDAERRCVADQPGADQPAGQCDRLYPAGRLRQRARRTAGTALLHQRLR